jgi:hypothetical protein
MIQKISPGSQRPDFGHLAKQSIVDFEILKSRNKSSCRFHQKFPTPSMLYYDRDENTAHNSAHWNGASPVGAPFPANKQFYSTRSHPSP